MSDQRRNRFWSLMCVVLVLVLLTANVAPPAWAAQPVDGAERVAVVIGFARQPGPAEQALVRGVGGAIKHTYHLVPGIAATLPQQAIEALRRNPVVTSIDLDAQVWAVGAELDNSWGVQRIGAGLVHTYNKGAGIPVAIIDSGINYAHPDLIANYKGGWDFVNNDGDPMDDHGHGTHVAGIVAAAANGFGVIGVAPEAHLYGLKVLAADGSGSWSDIIAGVQWAVDHGMRIANLSLGSDRDPGTIFRQAFDNAQAAGLLTVAAAGNSGTPAGRGNTVIYPARYDSVIAVAATDSSDRRASWSSTGDQVELAAPGVSVYSTLLGESYGYASGTSMASPHVAGAAALVWAAQPSWTNADVRAQLQNTADDLGATGRDPLYGFGLVNAARAVPMPATTGSITGQVTDSADGAAIAGATVSTDTGQSATTGAEGTYSISGVPTGQRSVTVSAVGFQSQTRSVVVSENQTTIVDFALALATGGTMHVSALEGAKSVKGKSANWEVAVTVTIRDSDGNPVANAMVTGEWSGAVSGAASGATGSAGTVTFATGNMSGGASVSFSVLDVVHASLAYDPGANVASSITIDK
jgi:subtilisin